MAYQIIRFMGNVVILIQNMQVVSGLSQGWLVRREMGTERVSQGGQNPRGDTVVARHRVGKTHGVTQ